MHLNDHLHQRLILIFYFILTSFHQLISFIKVESGDDVADMYIAEHVAPEDLVITADIPLAAEIVNKKAMAINPRGELYDEENVGERLSMRDFMKELRDGGIAFNIKNNINKVKKALKVDVLIFLFNISIYLFPEYSIRIK